MLTLLERRRWRPARQFLYARLFQRAVYLTGLLPWERVSTLSSAWYEFGSISYGDKALEEGLGDPTQVSSFEFEERVKELAGKPELMGSFQRRFDNTLGPGTDIFLAREPELNRLVNELRDRLSDFHATLETYQRRSSSGERPSRESREYFNVEGELKEAMDQALDRSRERRMEEAREEAMEQACIALSRLVLSAYDLRRWLTGKADNVKPMANSEGTRENAQRPWWQRLFSR